MNIIQTFEKGGKSIEVYGTYDKPLFLAKQIGEVFGFGNVRSSLDSIPDKWKVVQEMDTPGGRQKMTFLKEAGLNKLIMRSNKPELEPFQEWVCEDVLPSIRKTGEYKMNHKYIKNTAFKIQNEEDLHTKVVEFIKHRFPDSLFTATLGENQDTSQKRIKSFKMGYLKGSPDLIINNLHKSHSGFAIEFKSPTGKGKASKDQLDLLKKYKNNNFKTVISNDYDNIIESILDYFKDVRIKCKYCQRKFKSSDSLEQHHLHFHKIKRS